MKKLSEWFNKHSKLIFMISALICFMLFITLYIYVFHSGLSSNSNDWGNFGSYFGSVSSLVLSASILAYTYCVDSKQQRIMREERVIKLLVVVSESLSDLQMWYKLNSDKANNKPVENNEHNTIPIKILSNYKVTQILVQNLYNKTLPDVQNVYETEDHFKRVYDLVNQHFLIDIKNNNKGNENRS
ncbi:MAG: hypothetical protein IJL35_06015 [Bacteroidaceae bacterium]|nr:hypothetical protein [Bacteroidaceae bacterium]